jgi:mono/diheme cytochrome c family protein
MRRIIRLHTIILGLGTVAAILGIAGVAISQLPALPALPAHAGGGPMLPTELLTHTIDSTTPESAQLARGQYLVAAGDCMSCHLRDGGEPFAGGLGLNTPFGVIYSSNITSDSQTGIGAWTSEQFYQAMHDGKGIHGENLYPAFPYPSFRRASRADDDAILSFLKSTPAVNYTPPKNHLPFPLNVRSAVGGWNLLFLKSEEFTADPAQSAEWNRGAYLVNGLGHCGGCHTPKNALGADRSNEFLRGGDLETWVAPDLTDNHRTGLGDWNIEDIAEYLRTGRNARAAAGGPMADVITYSTSLMNDDDRRAIAAYLKSQPASPTIDASTPDRAAMQRGAEIYSDACTSCHLEDGVGQSRMFPPLGHDAMLQQANPAGLLHLVLAGTRIGTSASRPSPLSMPSFAWKLSDQEIADVSTFIRNSWGNQAAPVSDTQVSETRRKLNLETVHLTENSGDQN